MKRGRPPRSVIQSAPTHTPDIKDLVRVTMDQAKSMMATSVCSPGHHCLIRGREKEPVHQLLTGKFIIADHVVDMEEMMDAIRESRLTDASRFTVSTVLEVYIKSMATKYRHLRELAVHAYKYPGPLHKDTILVMGRNMETIRRERETMSYLFSVHLAVGNGEFPEGTAMWAVHSNLIKYINDDCIKAYDAVLRVLTKTMDCLNHNGENPVGPHIRDVSSYVGRRVERVSSGGDKRLLGTVEGVCKLSDPDDSSETTFWVRYEGATHREQVGRSELEALMSEWNSHPGV